MVEPFLIITAKGMPGNVIGRRGIVVIKRYNYNYNMSLSSSLNLYRAVAWPPVKRSGGEVP